MLDKEKALEIALAQIEKQFGKGAIMKLGDASANLNISAIPTGCIDLDIALGVGGIPRGRIIEVFGPESSGKTTIALHVVAQAQKMGGTAAFIDAEHALDPIYAPTPASRPWRSPSPWSVPAPSTWWWWTPWRPWCPRRRSRATWATPTWACRPGS